MEKDDINLIDINYRLDGNSVKTVLEYIDKEIEYFNFFLPATTISKGFFYGFLKNLNLEKDFCCYVKNYEGSEEVLYIPYIKKFTYELKENLNRHARIFETEEEDRTNKRHRKCILNMLPFIRDIGTIFYYFRIRCNEANLKFVSYYTNRFEKDIKSGNFCASKRGWRLHKRK